MSTCCKGRKANEEDNERHSVSVYKSHIDEPISKSSFERNNQEKGNYHCRLLVKITTIFHSLLCPFAWEEVLWAVTKESTVKLQDQYGQDARRQEAYPKAQGEQDTDLKRMAAYSKQKMDHGINMTSMDANFMPLQPLPPPPPSLPIGNVIANPIGHAAHEKSHSTGTLSSHCPGIFTIATLQQYSNSFSEENFVGEGTLGSVYRAELPTGKVRFSSLALSWFWECHVSFMWFHKPSHVSVIALHVLKLSWFWTYLRLLLELYVCAHVILSFVFIYYKLCQCKILFFSLVLS